MKSIVIFCVLLVACANAVSLLNQYPINYGKDRNILSAFIHVQNMMENQGPMDMVTEYLDDLTAKIQTEQKKHDAVQAKNAADCEDEFKFREKEIADATSARDTAEAQLANCQSQLRQAQADLGQNLENQKQKRASLESLIAARRQANAIFLKRVDDHKNAISACDEAVAMLKEIYSGAASFAQLAKTSTGLFKSAIALRKAEHYAPVLSVFSQIASKKVLADENALKKVNDLLINLKNNIQASLDNYTKIEADEVAEFKADKAQLEDEIASLEQQEKKLRAHISDMKVCIGVQTGIINSATAKFDRNTELLTIAKQMCESSKKNFDAATEKRNNELELVAKIKEIVVARYKQIAKSVRTRGMQSVEQWKKYKNKTVYDPAEAYRRVRGEANAAGAKQAGFVKNEKLAALEMN